MLKYKIFRRQVLTVPCSVAIPSLGLHLESLQELLEVHGPPGDLSPAGGTVVGLQLGPALTTDEVSTDTLEDLELAGVPHITDLRGDNCNIAEEK